MSPPAKQIAKKKTARRKSVRTASPEWKETIAELRQRQRRMKELAKVLGLDPDSGKATIIQDLLLAEVFKLATEKRRASLTFLQQVQRTIKGVFSTAPEKGKPAKVGKDAADLTRQLEQIYGPGVVVVEELKDAR
jgi:hypothetical protein